MRSLLSIRQKVSESGFDVYARCSILEPSMLGEEFAGL